MLFNSLEFGIFLPIVFAAYWTVGPHRIRLQNVLLIAASYLFYGWWDWRFLGLIVASSAVDYVVGSVLHASREPWKRKALLGTSIAVNLGILGVFKYYDFFASSMAALLTDLGMRPNIETLGIILPVGISFYTFQTLSYTIDIYRERLEPTRDPIAFFAFVSFFPQLVAGPIERAAALLPQFSRPRSFDPDLAADGMRQILWGLVKKVVVADNAARTSDLIFADPSAQHPFMVIVGVFLFAMQIYGDFSGYSDIAIGTARLFGFSLMQNFAFPYFSRDIAEFWRRWHISLSSWFRDYVFIPLGGSRQVTAVIIRNIVITFTVSGLWHGANWTFIIWGLLNGLAYIPLLVTGRNRQFTDVVAEGRLLPSVADTLRILGTFTFTLVAWVFFRASDLGQALEVFEHVATASWSGPLAAGLAPVHVLYALAMLLVEWLQRDKQHALQIEGSPVVGRRLAYCALIVAVLVLGYSGETTFIYFQF